MHSTAFHYRTGKDNGDGSRGEIKITPKQLKDVLAYMFNSGLKSFGNAKAL